MYIIVVLLIALLMFVLYLKNKQYRETAYYQITHNSFLHVHFDAGLYGEYLTYKYLKVQEEKGAKFLFNLYVPKENGKTSEIDVIMIHQKEFLYSKVRITVDGYSEVKHKKCGRRRSLLVEDVAIKNHFIILSYKISPILST